jgi:cell division protein FtsL
MRLTARLREADDMIKRTTFITATLAISLGFGLFVVKYQVQDLEDELAMIDQKIVSERQTMHVLKAEWSHLNEPGRLKELAVRHLAMVPLDYKQYIAVTTVAQQLGTPETEMSSEEDISSFSDRMNKALTEGTER